MQIQKGMMCSHVISSIDIVHNEDYDPCCEDEYTIEFSNGTDNYKSGVYNVEINMKHKLKLVNRKLKYTVENLLELTFESTY